MSIFHFKPLRQQTDEQLMARAAAIQLSKSCIAAMRVD